MKLDGLMKEIMEVLPLSVRTIRNEMRHLALPELSIAQFRILTRLNIYPHTNKQIAEWMGITPATMTRTIDILVNRGFVKRETSSSDRRAVKLALTAKGLKKYQNVEDASKVMLKEKLLVLDEKSLKDVHHALGLLRKVFQSDQLK